MKIKSKIIFMVILIFMLQLQSCSFTSKNITTDTGTELSTELTEVINFIGSVKAVYITIGTIVGTAYDNNFITEKEFTKIATLANEFKLDLKKSQVVMLSWYNLEESKVLNSREELKREAINLLLEHLDKLIVAVQETKGISLENRNIINAGYSMLNTIYNTGGVE